MGKHPAAEAQTRKSIVLADAMWAEIDEARRATPGKMPSEMEMVRRLLREALDARAAHGGRGTTPAR